MTGPRQRPDDRSQDIGQSAAANTAWRYELEQLARGITTATQLLKSSQVPREIDRPDTRSDRSASTPRPRPVPAVALGNRAGQGGCGAEPVRWADHR
jgi:hypothetical protein